MKFFAATALIAAIAGTVTAVPTAEPAEIEARNSGIECCEVGGKWHYGWTGSKPSQQFLCKTTGVINVLNCVSVLNGNSVSVPISIILPPL